MVASVAVALPSHDSVEPTLLRSRLHFRNITPLGQRCIMVATVAVAFPSHDCVGPTLYNGCNGRAAFPSHHSIGPALYNGCYGRGCISVTSLRWANVV